MSRLRLRRGRALAAIAILLSFLISAFSARLATASSSAETNQDIVFLIDISSSMRDIFDDVKRAILDYSRQARPGDNVVLISFGEKVSLRFRQKISSDKDVERIESELQNLEPTEYFTNITGALERGMEELRRLEQKNPDHRRTIVLMSDGKNNPPDDVARPMTFEEMLEQYPHLTREGGSGFFYLSLGEDPDPQVMSFMEEAGGLSFDMGEDGPHAALEEKKQPLVFAQVFVEPVSIDLGIIHGPEASVPVSLAFFPYRGDPSGKTIMVSMSARFKGNPSWKTIVEVRPSAIDCSARPWSKSFTVRVDSAEQGTIIGTLELKPATGQVLFIEPSEIPITMTIRQPHVEVTLEERLDFGPIDPRWTYEETQRVLLIPNSEAEGEPIKASCSIVPPEGMSIAAKVEKNEGLLELVVTVATDESFSPEHSLTLEGTVRLTGSEHALSFSHDGLEIRIRSVPPGAESRSLGIAVSDFFSRAGKWIAYILIGALAATILGVGGYLWFSSRPRSALEGKLVLVHLRGKKPEKSKTVTINLHNVGKSIGRDSIIFGSAKDVSITLPHKSVAAHHLEIYAEMDKGVKRIFAEPVGKKFVIINLQKITEPTPLSDKDLVEIGAYTFRFENPHPYKQIVVRYLDRRIAKGTPATWDIESDGFGLLPRDALPGSTEEIFVSFADLKAVYFVRDFDGQIGKKLESPETQILGIRMRLTFHDGERIVGFTAQAYDPTSSRFYFFPADQSGNTISMLVEREPLRNLEVPDPTDTEGFKPAGGVEPM